MLTKKGLAARRDCHTSNPWSNFQSYLQRLHPAHIFICRKLLEVWAFIPNANSTREHFSHFGSVSVSKHYEVEISKAYIDTFCKKIRYQRSFLQSMFNQRLEEPENNKEKGEVYSVQRWCHERVLINFMHVLWL